MRMIQTRRPGKTPDLRLYIFNFRLPGTSNMIDDASTPSWIVCRMTSRATWTRSLHAGPGQPSLKLLWGLPARWHCSRRPGEHQDATSLRVSNHQKRPPGHPVLSPRPSTRPMRSRFSTCSPQCTDWSVHSRPEATSQWNLSSGQYSLAASTRPSRLVAKGL